MKKIILAVLAAFAMNGAYACFSASSIGSIIQPYVLHIPVFCRNTLHFIVFFTCITMFP